MILNVGGELLQAHAIPDDVIERLELPEMLLLLREEAANFIDLPDLSRRMTFP